MQFYRTLAALMLIFITNQLTAQNAQKTDIIDNIKVSAAGKFISSKSDNKWDISSENRQYACFYDIGRVSDEERELMNFRLYDNGRLIYSLPIAPGSDLMISNTGITVFMDMKNHFKGELTVHFYSKFGKFLFSRKFRNAAQFKFSSSGNKFGVMDSGGLNIISFDNKSTKNYEGGYQFDFSDDGKIVTVAQENRVKIYLDGSLEHDIHTGMQYTRKICISGYKDIVAVIDKRNIKTYSTSSGELLFSNSVDGDYSFRDLIMQEDKITAGIHYRDENISRGITKIYDFAGIIIDENVHSEKQLPVVEKNLHLTKSVNGYRQVPWPFQPFDSMHTVWNYYEQHMGRTSSSYLHQGLDMITPINEPTFAVEGGIVKCVLTLGGASYWRLAISEEQSSGYSEGWLYAHLVESSIQVDVGDTVNVHDYLGDIIAWTSEWGHIHFARIRDSGTVWQYTDNEWGIVHNPLLSLVPDTDPVSPVIQNVFHYSKFGFCVNETSSYLSPDSLFGNIDVIVKVSDYVGDSGWEQPAFRSYYWVKSISDGTVVFPRTLGHILNHQYDFYASSHYTPIASVLYKRDEYLSLNGWMSMTRNYYHILTNNNGDSLLSIDEKNLAFSTTDYPDGEYRLFVEVYDEYGNSALDSMDVMFKNDVTAISEPESGAVAGYNIRQNYPNPFNPETNIRFTIPEDSKVVITIYDIQGRNIRGLTNKILESGDFTITWDGRNDSGNHVSSGLYFCRFSAGDFTQTMKMILIR